MIYDCIFIAQVLQIRYPQIYYTLKTNCEANGVKFYPISNTMNIWIRDWFPVQINSNEWAKFKYKEYPDHPWMQVPDSCFDFIGADNYDIYLDGGNVVLDSKKVIMTDAVFKNNPDRDTISLVDELEEIFGREVIIIPQEPDDIVGHADGTCVWYHKNDILITDYSKMSPDYNLKLVERLRSHNLKIERVPCIYDSRPKLTENKFRELYPYADSFESGWGYYINFLKVNGMIFFPVFGVKEDHDAMKRIMELYPSHNIIAVDCGELSQEGGLVHCITSQARMEIV